MGRRRKRGSSVGIKGRRMGYALGAECAVEPTSKLRGKIRPIQHTQVGCKQLPGERIQSISIRGLTERGIGVEERSNVSPVVLPMMASYAALIIKPFGTIRKAAAVSAAASWLGA